MACGDVLSLEDLQTAKKHQTFEAEVITGKQGGVSGGADIDYATNQVTGQTQKTLPAVLRDAGFEQAPFTFTTGGALGVNERNKAVFDPVSKAWYIWLGALPKVVPAGANPVGDADWKPWTDPTLRSDLANYGGASLVGGVSQIFSTVDEMKSFNVEIGRRYQTSGYHSHGDGGGADYLAAHTGATAPDGYGDHLATNGVILQLISDPTDLRHGIKLNNVYVPAEARNNRNALQAMMRNERWNYTECVAGGTYYLLGSANIGRDNIQLHIHKGCFIRGRYSDPSIPTPDQAGHMLGFAHFFDPDNGDFIPFAPGDARVNAPVKNVTVILDGDVATEYNSVHSNQYNNNAIGFLKGVDCRVIGSGGVSESDHRGIIFDGVDTNAPGGSDNRGGSINCHIDVSYINNCVDNPAAIVADINTPSLNTITIGRVGFMKSGGYNDPIVANVFNGADFVVKIGSFIGDNIVKPALVVARNARSVKVRVGICNGAKSLLYSDLTLDNDVECEEIYNTPLGLVRAGSVSGKCRVMRLAGVKATDSNFAMAYSSQNNTGPFLRLSLTDNNFASVANSFLLFGGKNSAALPRISDIRDNVLPDALTTITELNMLPSGFKLVPITVGSTSESVNFKSPDWNYSKMSILASDAGGIRYQLCIDIRTRDVTNQPVNLDVGTSGGLISSTKSGSVITLTCTNCNLQTITLHN